MPYAGRRVAILPGGIGSGLDRHMQSNAQFEPQVLHVPRFQEPDIVRFADAVDATHKIYEKRWVTQGEGAFTAWVGIAVQGSDVAVGVWKEDELYIDCNKMNKN